MKQRQKEKQAFKLSPPRLSVWWSPPLVLLPGDEREGRKEEKHLWVKWCEKERLGAFIEEMAFLWRGADYLLYLMRWRSELKTVWKRWRYGGWSRSKRKWTGHRDWWQGLISLATSPWISTSLCNLTRCAVNKAGIIPPRWKHNTVEHLMGIMRCLE